MIKEDDLYRIFKINKGNYKGDYKLYFNKNVAQYFLKDVNIYKWGDEKCLEAEPGDYIEAMDGAVVMLLKKRKYVTKAGVDHYFFRFPMCTIACYFAKTKGYRFREFYAQMTYLNKNRVVSAVRYGTDNQKTRFVSYILIGMHPFKAYRLAFGKREPLEIATLHKRINSLMSDDIVRQEMKTQIEPFAEQLTEEFPDNRLVRELNNLLSSSKPGSDAHRENIKFIMALLNKLPQALYPGNRAQKALAQDVNYSEDKPPQHMLNE